MSGPLGLGVGLWMGSGGGAAAAVIPTGSLLGVWYADQYDATAKAVPNEVTKATVPLVANIATLPRRRFATSTIWGTGGSGATVTDIGATAADGTASASRIVGAGTNWLSTFTAIIPTTGTYTLGLWVKSNTASNQNFYLAFFTAGSTSTQKTATPTWQRFSFSATLTAGSHQIFPMWANGAPAGDFLFSDVDLSPGAVDLGATSQYGGHMYLGRHGAALPTYASGELDFSAAISTGFISFATDQTVTDFTTIALISKIATGSTAQVSLTDPTTFANLAVFTDNSNAPCFKLTGSTYGVPSLNGNLGLYDLLNKGYHAIITRVSGSTLDIWIDDLKMYAATITPGSASLTDLLVGAATPTSFGAGWKLAALALAGRAWTDTEANQAYTVTKAHAVASGLTVTPQARVAAFTGDSITAGALVTSSYPSVFGPNANPVMLGTNWAVTGYTLADLEAQATRLDAILPSAAAQTGRKFILTVFIGANDGTQNTSTYIARLAAYCDARRAAGWKVVLCTLLPNSHTNFIAFRNTINAGIYAWTAGQHYDGLCDFAADSLMGGDTAYTNTTYYLGDGIHPTQTGQNRLETIVRPVINGL